MRAAGELRQHYSYPTSFPKRLCLASGLTVAVAKRRVEAGTVVTVASH